MNVLFIYSRFGGKNPYYVDFSFRVPLGVSYLGAVAKREGFEVFLRDGLFYEDWKDFEKDVKEIRPDVVGVSFTTALKKYAIQYIKIIRELFPNTAIVVGGSHPTVNPFEVMSEFNVDFIIYGEGEKTLPELLNFIKDGKKDKQNNINGLVYKYKGEIRINPPREFIQNLDEIPWPARELLPMEKYLSIAPLMPLPYPATNIVVSRGCPGNCLFCQPTLKKLAGQKPRYREVGEVIKEIKFLIDKYNIKSLDLGVDEPTYSKEWVNDFCDTLIKEKINIKWGTPSRVDTVSKELLEKMAKAGCVYISYGVETGSQKIMNILRKGTKVEQAENALKWTEEAGICGRANLMIGSPGETKETIMETVNFIKRVKPDFIFVAATTPLYGTDLYDLAEREGILIETKEGITGYNFGHLKLKDLSNEDLEEALHEIVKTYKRNLLSFVLNPRMLIKKKHIYIRMFLYFWYLLRNKKEFMRIFRYYTKYGEQIQVKRG